MLVYQQDGNVISGAGKFIKRCLDIFDTCLSWLDRQKVCLFSFFRSDLSYARKKKSGDSVLVGNGGYQSPLVHCLSHGEIGENRRDRDWCVGARVWKINERAKWEKRTKNGFGEFCGILLALAGCVPKIDSFPLFFTLFAHFFLQVVFSSHPCTSL